MYNHNLNPAILNLISSLQRSISMEKIYTLEVNYMALYHSEVFVLPKLHPLIQEFPNLDLASLPSHPPWWLGGEGNLSTLGQGQMLQV